MGARAARAALLPASLIYRLAMQARARAYGAGWFRVRAPRLPVVSVGNLSVGGSGKTPLTSWIAAFYRDRGWHPGIVLRDYGGDEARLHRRLLPGVPVVVAADRWQGVNRLAAAGVQVAVLDDAYQRLDLARHLDILVVSAESMEGVAWSLPAGPWREAWSAAGRADLVLVTRRQVPGERAAALAQRMQRETTVPIVQAAFRLPGFRGLRTGRSWPAWAIRGRSVLVGAGVADPVSLARQCTALGARVRRLPFPDHHRFVAGDVERMLHLGEGLDYVVVTEKDAVKLEGLWPEEAPEPLVADMAVAWEAGRAALEAELLAVVTRGGDLFSCGPSPARRGPAPTNRE